MGDLTVYTDPQTPGAPQVGDVVVVARVYPAGDRVNLGDEARLSGRVCRLEKLNEVYGTPWPWGCGRKIGVVHAIRRPTEAELVEYHLAHGGTP